jgi:hypothetical protein
MNLSTTQIWSLLSEKFPTSDTFFYITIENNCRSEKMSLMWASNELAVPGQQAAPDAASRLAPGGEEEER